MNITNKLFAIDTDFERGYCTFFDADLKLLNLFTKGIYYRSIVSFNFEFSWCPNNILDNFKFDFMGYANFNDGIGFSFSLIGVTFGVGLFTKTYQWWSDND